MARMLTRHQRTARRGTDIASRKHLSKPETLRRHLVDIGRLKDGMPHGRPLKESPLIQHDIDDIRLLNILFFHSTTPCSFWTRLRSHSSTLMPPATMWLLSPMRSGWRSSG